LWRFFESRTEYLTCREWHSEWHAARMRKPLTRVFLDLERLSLREQVQGSGDFADIVVGEVLATVVAWAGLRKTAVRGLGEPGGCAGVDVVDHGWEFDRRAPAWGVVRPW
jgi:hypothetical protein